MSTPSLASAKLLQPFKLGNMHLQHRVVMAPMTRLRANKHHVHGDLALQYYTQRSSTPGTFLISEATLISPESGGYPNIPGIYNDAQVAAWKKVSSSPCHLPTLSCHTMHDSDDPIDHEGRTRQWLLYFLSVWDCGPRSPSSSARA